MLAIEKLQVAYGKVQALWDVTLGVPDGEIVALVGANGAGKTTLLKTVSGLLRRQSGSITYDGKHIEEASPPEIVQHGLVHVPEGRKLFPEMTVIDNLLMGAFTVPQSERPQRLERVFNVFPVLKERRKQIAGTLSGGEQQMVAIGRGLMGGPKLLMLDEPSLGLAPILVEEVFRVITEINRLGVTVLLVEQNTQNALSLAHKGFVMELGRIALSGSGSELLANSNVRKAYLGTLDRKAWDELKSTGRRIVKMAILEEPIKGVKEVKNYINGEWVDSKGKIVDVVNPATGKVMGKCPISTKEEINAAVDAAKAAFPDWRRTTPLARSRILFRLKGFARRKF